MRTLRDHLSSHPLPWLRSLLIAGLLLVSAGLTRLASEWHLMLALYLVLGAGAVALFWHRPGFGLIVTVAAGMVIPFTGAGGINISLGLVALLLGLWLLDMVARQRKLRFAASRPVWPLLGFVLTSLLAFGVGQLPWFHFASHAPLDAQLGGVGIVLLSAGAFLLAAHQLTDLGAIRRLTWAFIALGTLSVLLRSILPELGINTRSVFLPPGTAFYVWLVAMAFGQAVFNVDLQLGTRLLLGAIVLTTLFVLLYLKFDDKSGWISALIAMTGVLGARWWRAALVLAPVGVAAALVVAPQAIGTDQYSLSTRLEAWLILGEMIKISPLLGLGFANYYWYTPLYSIRGYAVSFNSHNNYVDIVAQTGLVGLFFLLCFFWEMGRLVWKLREWVPTGFGRAYVYGAAGGLAATVVIGMLGDWVLPFVYNIGLNGFRSSVLIWLFLGGLVSLERLVSTPREAK
jgi:O-antigen ligase